MPFLPVVIPPGVVRGATPNDARGRWYDTNLVRWTGGVLEPVGGWEKLVTAPFPDRVRKLASWRTNVQQQRLIVATDRKVYAYDGSSSFADVTPAGLITAKPAFEYTGFGVNDFGEEAFGTARSVPSANIQVVNPYWTFSNWGEDLLGVLSVDNKLYWYDASSPSTPFAAITGAPDGLSAVHVTPERHVMGLQAWGEPRRIAWSSREDASDWDFSSLTNTAGYLDLETQTPLLKAIQSRAGVLVFSSTDLFLMQYLGLPYIYGQQHLGATRPLSVDSIVADNGNVFWWASDGFKAFDGGSITTLECPVWEYIKSRVNPNAVRSVAHGGALGLYPEIWWFYPTGDSLVCNSYVMTNYAEGWWAIGDMPRSAMVGAGADKFPIMAGEDSLLYRHESGWNGSDGNVREVYAETAALALGAGDRSMEIKQVLPAGGHGYDSLQFLFRSKLTPEGAEREFGPYSVRSDGYMDVRVSGRDVRVRVENKRNADWSIGELRFDVGQGGGR